jgi:hypothetical protein
MITREYFLPKTLAGNLVDLRVCQYFFLNTLAINQQWVLTALEKSQRSTAIISPDRRGSFPRAKSPTVTERDEKILEHINLFPKVPSHYCRARSSKLYLDPALNVAKMHRLYLEWAKDKGLSKVATLRQYRDQFNMMNISFFVPRKDQCNHCSSYDNTPIENRSETQIAKYNRHINDKQTVRDIKSSEKAKALVDSSFVVATFDF